MPRANLTKQAQISKIVLQPSVLQQVWFNDYRAIQSVQDKAWVEGNGYSLVKTHNAGLNALDCSLRASQKAVIHVVALFVKGATIPCKARLVANRFLARCIHQTKPVGVLAIAIALAINGSVAAKTFTVSNTNDAGTGSLRAAVSDANTHEGIDNIIFTTPDGSQITLSAINGEIMITDDLTITGPTANKASSVTIKAASNARIFNVNDASLTLENLTLTGGSPLKITTDTDYDSGSGGAIYMNAYYNSPALELVDTVITGNQSPAKGGAIYSTNRITLTRSRITNNKTTKDKGEGGGIYSFGDITLNQSTISGNSTNGINSDGGGLNSHGGGVNLNQSTVSGNSTSGIDSDGGGIYAHSLTMDQSTISGNSVGKNSEGGGAFIAESLANARYINDNTPLSHKVNPPIITNTIKQSTITNNTSQSNVGGISFYLTTTDTVISNTIISGNAGSGGNDTINDIQIKNISGIGKLHLSHNIIGDSKAVIDPGNFFIDPDVNNLFSTPPKLEALQNNGGLTQTHLAQPNSPAIDKGDNTLAPAITDQRGTGYFRIIGKPATAPTVDIGATERVIPMNTAVQCTEN